MLLLALLMYNVGEAIIAINYPKAAPAPAISLLKPKATLNSTPKKSFNILSPNVCFCGSLSFEIMTPVIQSSPQVQKPFAFSPQASAARSFGAASFGLSTPGANNKSTYAQSPVDTPSRILNYNPLLNSSTNSQGSSTNDYLQTPSPVVSAYRGKHSGADVGRKYLFLII